jgi:ABC-type uncharacterized transport system permease subunit
MRLLITNIGVVSFALCIVAAYYHLRRRGRWASPLLLLAGFLAVAANTSHLIASIQQVGVVETFRHSFESTLLLASLIGLMALGTHLSTSLRGLDGFLFIGALVVQVGAAILSNRTDANEASYRPWFVSHSLAFEISAACFIASGAAGVVYLIMNQLLHKRRPSTLVGAVAPLESLERFGRWTLSIGFPLFTFGILTGICEMVRSKNPGPTAWLHDPLVVGSFVIWTVYALMVGLMWLRPRMRGQKAAALATCGMGLVAFVFLVIEFMSPLHR